MQHLVSPHHLQSRSRLLSRICPPHAFGLRLKLFLALIGLVISLTLGLLLIVESRQRASIVHQMEKRGETIATTSGRGEYEIPAHVQFCHVGARCGTRPHRHGMCCTLLSLTVMDVWQPIAGIVKNKVWYCQIR